MKVVLFCGGLGLRIRQHPDSPPKPMTMIGDHPLVWHVMRYYAHFGLTDFILCLGYGAPMIKNYFRNSGSGWRVTLVDTGPHSSIGDRLLRVRSHVDGDLFLANYADTLTDADLPTVVARFRHSTATAGLLAVPLLSSHHVVRLDPSSQISAISTVRDLGQWANGGYFVFRPEIFDVLREGEDLVPHALNRLIPAGRLLAHPHTGFWRAVDTFKDRIELDERYQRGDAPWALWDPRRRRAPGPVPALGGVPVSG
jgi:glucose-1-phosphate cytidylyltransferase